jgi:hypothetical protein
MSSKNIRQSDSVMNTDPKNKEYWERVARHWFAERNLEKKKRQTSDMKLIRTEEMLDEYKIAYDGLTSKRNDESKKLATQDVNSDYAAHSDIQDVVKDRKGPFNFKITGVIAALILGLVFIWQVSSNAEFREWFNKNTVAFALIVVAIAAIYIYVANKKK